jgi:hypothetical protein
MFPRIYVIAADSSVNNTNKKSLSSISFSAKQIKNGTTNYRYLLAD